MYSDVVLDHFQSPRYVGQISGADAEAEDQNPVCGDRLHLWLRIRDGVIREVAWRAEGCVPAIAAASVMSELLQGMDVQVAREIDRDDLVKALGGLPARKDHAVLLALSTLRKALANSRE